MFNTTNKSAAQIAAEIEASVLELCKTPKTIHELHVAIGGASSFTKDVVLRLEVTGDLQRVTANPNGYADNTADRFKTTAES